jgi:chromosome segregation ATPase
MGTRKSPSAPQWQVILEEIRSQNRSTLEAVEAFRQSIEERIERLDRESRGRDELLALAVTGLQREVRQHSTDLTELRRLSLRHGADIVELKELGREHSRDIADLRRLSEQHGTDISELKALGQAQSSDIAELKAIGHEHGSGIAGVRAEMRELKVTVQENTVELRSLSQKVDALNRLEERVAVLERRAAGPEGSSTPPHVRGEVGEGPA